MKTKQEEEKILNDEVKEPDWKEQFLRISADFQNYKRRIEKEKQDWVSMAQIKIIEAFLPLLDELRLAISSSEKYKETGNLETWIDGFKMIQKNLVNKLESLGVKEIDCTGKFDPNFHEALIQVESLEHKSGDIVVIISPGYIFNNQVIRHAKVSVAK